MSVAPLGPGEGHMKLGKIGLVSDGLGWVKTWCGLILVWDILVWDMSWCGLILVRDNFGVGYVANGVVWDMLRCGICRCGISRGTSCPCIL